jgi:N-succinyldiaminopimelate aminotransferase
VNSRLDALQPYPFERLRSLLQHTTVPAGVPPIRLSVGEPQHPAPDVVRTAVTTHLDGLSHYPLTAGSEPLRAAIARWYATRFGLSSLDPRTQVLPVNGSREALFAFAQCVVNGVPGALVACPNPFYQIYEGAALLAGADTVFMNQVPEDDYALDPQVIPESQWARVQLVYICSPGNPSGRVLRLDDWQRLFDLSDRFGFVIASDECYSEIYPDENAPPMGALQAASMLGRHDYRQIVSFTSLSKRSNVPGLRSGAVAGDAALLGRFLRYRTYHGCAMSPVVQEASMAAWNDEIHVRQNRDRYRAKFAAVVPLLAATMQVSFPEAGFYLWAGVPTAYDGDDERLAVDLVSRAGVEVLPGRYLARDAHGINPGAGRVRMALVASENDCIEAARRIVACCRPSSTTGAHVTSP